MEEQLHKSQFQNNLYELISISQRDSSHYYMHSMEHSHLRGQNTLSGWTTANLEDRTQDAYGVWSTANSEDRIKHGAPFGGHAIIGSPKPSKGEPDSQ